MKKKCFKLIVFFFMVMLIIACGNNNSKVNQVIQNQMQDAQIDVDLTKLSSIMVYSEVYNMIYEPEKYIGKLIKMKGDFNLFQNTETGQLYFACIISDATACCTQGIEFELEGEHVYPDDYPEVGTEIVVTGIFETYEEDGYMYCRLKNANMQ